jgi:predicted ATP-binding protein involved in virulence
MNDQMLRVSSVSVTGLFGIYDHSFDLNSTDRVTILHGPNGVGKTILFEDEEKTAHRDLVFAIQWSLFISASHTVSVVLYHIE